MAAALTTPIRSNCDRLIGAFLNSAADVPRGRERDADAAAQANAIFLALVNG